MYILIASQYNWNGIHYWVYNTNTKGVPHIRFITYIRKTTKKK